MKYLKFFNESESSELFNKNFWILSTKSPDFEISLDKIGISPDDIPDYIEYYKSCSIKTVIFNIYSYVESGITLKYWSHVADNLNNRILLKKLNYQNMGKVILTHDDFEKYEIKNNANKYNL